MFYESQNFRSVPPQPTTQRERQLLAMLRSIRTPEPRTLPAPEWIIEGFGTEPRCSRQRLGWGLSELYRTLAFKLFGMKQGALPPFNLVHFTASPSLRRGTLYTTELANRSCQYCSRVKYADILLGVLFDPEHFVFYLANGGFEIVIAVYVED